MEPMDRVRRDIANAEERRSRALLRGDSIAAEHWRGRLEELELHRQRLALVDERQAALDAALEELKKRDFVGGRWWG